jgi:2,4-dienoyl-CoA reductase-like NADH-dependent reductase (Old Yellow Enzyme family)
MSELLDKCFSPASLNRLQLRNRVIRAAIFEGMTAGGKPSDKLIDLNRSAAEGGVGMTPVAYCAVEADSRVMDEMMYMHEAIRPQLLRPTSEVHATRNSLGLVGCDNCFDKQRIRGEVKDRKVSYFLILL